MKDGYGNLVDETRLVLLPDINLLNDAGIKTVANANWYQVTLKDGTEVSPCAVADVIDCLSENSADPENAGFAEVLLINDVLKRWSVEDGFYSA